MPRKHRDVRAGLTTKGFSVEEGRKHIHFVYEDLEGRTTTARTMLSHGAGGEDISDNLLGRMAREVGLKRADFLNLVDCPMSREEFDAKIIAEEQRGD